MQYVDGNEMEWEQAHSNNTKMGTSYKIGNENWKKTGNENWKKDQSSDFHWPAKLHSVRPRTLEQSTSLAMSPRTVAEHFQASAEDSAFPACVNHRPAPL